MNTQYDLHTHSQASDGSLSPESLVQHAKECGLLGLCITDHDTIAAYATAIPAARAAGLKLGVGVEFSCLFGGHDVHLLGYDFDLHSTDIQALCLRHQNRRSNRNLAMLEKLRLHQIDISLEGCSGSVGRPHMAYIMMQKGYVGSIKEAFNRYLGEGKSCYVRGESVSVEETIDVIHKAGGKAFIAHPHLLMPSFPVEELLQHAFDGIECWYAKMSYKSAERWVAVALSKNWLMSGGSDFHGSIKPELSLGCRGVEEAVFDRIFEKGYASAL